MTAADDEDRQPKMGLDWKDYVAVTVAALETTLLPLVVVILVLAFLLLVFR